MPSQREKDQQAAYLIERGWKRIWDAPDGVKGWWWVHDGKPDKLFTRSAAYYVETH